MSRDFATGRDDPELAETSWPLPDRAGHAAPDDLEWQLRYGKLDRSTNLKAAGIVAAYRALIEDGTCAQQQRRLAALRRVQRRRIEPCLSGCHPTRS